MNPSLASSDTQQRDRQSTDTPSVTLGRRALRVESVPSQPTPAPADRPAGRSADPVDQCVMDDEFVTSVFPALHRAAWKLTGDRAAADDLAQETLIVALRKWDSFDGRSTRSTWLHGILIRLARKHFRTLARIRRRIERYVKRAEKNESVPDSTSVLAETEWQQSIWAEVAKLPRGQAETITLRFGQQLSYEEIAQALGCAVGTAKSRVHQGLKRLRHSSPESHFFYK